MAKLQHTFIQGKMNKDLDERLVPNGQYRDAKNIQVSTSEGSDVGAVENILGNTKKNLRSTGPDVFWQDNFGLQNPVCIGVIKDSQNEKIYWFLNSADSSTDAIVEYDQTTGIVAPILVDVNGVLNFNKLNLITGVNILEGMLFWTDDRNEPRRINVATFKAGSTDFTTQTHVYGATRDFIASDITVIKKAPQQSLSAVAAASLIGGFGTGITPINTDPENFGAREVGDVVTIEWTGQNITPSFWTNKRAVLTANVLQADNSNKQYEVTGVFATQPASPNEANLTIESLSSDIPSSLIVWELLLIETEPIFKDDFPRFSYRYKYSDGEYSPYATFTKPAFVPGQFEYLSRDGNNIGMASAIRKISLGNFQQTPANVDEVEVLYKGSRSNNVYLIESFKYDFSQPIQPVLSLDITASTLGRVIESSQLLRPWDNVPKKAKAQEVIGNRVIYGNYLQNYDIANSSIDVVAIQNNATHTSPVLGLPSVKTDRDYQIGVTFIDSSGRETPVFTAKNGAISLDKANAQKVNSVRAKLNTFAAPSWADKFKYYIKESTPEYYNIALDRFYNAEDGAIWLSFPSSERNKLNEGQFVTLKKEHGNSQPVTLNNKYKVTSIENEAPDYIRYIKTVVGRVSGYSNVITNSNGFIVGDNRIEFLAPEITNNENFFNGFKNKCYIQFLSEAGNGGSDIYSVISGGPTGTTVTVGSDTYANFEATLSEGIASADLWLGQLTADDKITIIIYQDQNNVSPDFQGRFFAKVTSNATLRESIKDAFASTAPSLVFDQQESILFNNMPNSVTTPTFAWEDTKASVNPGDGVTLNSDTFYISAAPTTSNVWYNSAEESFWNKLVGGTYIEFEFINGSKSVPPYKIIDVVTTENDPRISPGTGVSQTKTITLDRPYTDKDPAVQLPFSINVLKNRYLGDNTTLSSTNPAIFETEPQELADLDIYYEATDPLNLSDLNTYQTLDWFNCYSFGNGVESDRIRDDYNAPTLGNGVRVSSTLEEPYREERRATGLIFSGIFNSISGVNNTNQFLIAESITKDLNPTYGSIQKLHARDTDLIALLEDKCFKILANKDALFNADGNTNVTSNANVLGQTIPFVGEYGISKNPESFASFGFRAYFTDKARGAVMRLSRDGLTDISDKGMSYFFQDGLKTNVNPNIIGAYDSDAGSYNVVVGGEGVSFKEKSDGWNTRLSYDPEAGISLNNEYYTFKNGELYEHSNATRSNFYGVQEDTTVTPVFNDAPTSVKNFKTLSYEGDEGWIASIATNKQSGTVSTWKEREGIYFNYIMGDATTLANIDLKEFSTQGLGQVLSHAAGSAVVVVNGELNVSLQPGDVVYSNDPGNTLRVIGTVLVADRQNNSIRLTSTITGAPPVTGDFLLFGKDSQVNTSGLLGYYGEAVFSTSSSNKKELFAVNSEVFISSE